MRWGQLISSIVGEYRLADAPRIVKIDPEATEAIDAYHEAVRQRMLIELHDRQSFPARWAEQAWRISLVLHAGLHGPKAHTIAVSVETARGGGPDNTLVLAAAAQDACRWS